VSTFNKVRIPPTAVAYTFLLAVSARVSKVSAAQRGGGSEGRDLIGVRVTSDNGYYVNLSATQKMARSPLKRTGPMGRKPLLSSTLKETD